MAWPGKCRGWPDRLLPSEKSKLAPGDGCANASSGRSTDAAFPQSIPNATGGSGVGVGSAVAVGDAGLDDAGLGPGGVGVVGAAPQASTRTAIAPTAVGRDHRRPRADVTTIIG